MTGLNELIFQAAVQSYPQQSIIFVQLIAGHPSPEEKTMILLREYRSIFWPQVPRKQSFSSISHIPEESLDLKASVHPALLYPPGVAAFPSGVFFPVGR